MNILKFTAKKAYASKDDDCYMVGFADDEYDYTHYVLLQRAFMFDEQDTALDMDGEYIEIDGQENSGYKQVESALFDKEHFILNIKSDNKINRVAVDLSQTEMDEVQMTKFLLEILPDKVHFL